MHLDIKWFKNNRRSVYIHFQTFFSCFHSRNVIKLKKLSRGFLNYFGCVQNILLIQENMKIVA